MSAVSNKSAEVLSVPSMPGPAADGTYSPSHLSAYVLRHGRWGAMRVSTDGILALASGVEVFLQKLTEVAEAAAELRSVEDHLVGGDEREQFRASLDRIDAAVFGPGGTTPNEEDQGK